MKKITLIFAFISISIFASAQVEYFKFFYDDFNNTQTYRLSPAPYITSFGEYSDSLSTLFNGVDFYELNGEYFPVKSWADYYYWYTQSYYWLFVNPEKYEHHYLAKNNKEMVKYIFSDNYKTDKYPSAIMVYIMGDEDNKEYLCENMHKFISVDEIPEVVEKLSQKPENVDYSKERETKLDQMEIITGKSEKIYLRNGNSELKQEEKQSTTKTTVPKGKKNLEKR
ncbi:MAG: hypothetical protein KAR57_00430 [Bacteroidales bacterium]|nr:hypothetical protein [Bacteroidales bacterium]